MTHDGVIFNLRLLHSASRHDDQLSVRLYYTAHPVQSSSGLLARRVGRRFSKTLPQSIKVLIVKTHFANGKRLAVTWLHASNLINMATNGKPRLGTPVTPVTPTIASQINRNVPPKPSQPPSIPPPAPVIPVSLLQPNEQRLLITSFFGLLEVSGLYLYI